ncbi:hypothetical protein ACFWPQ_22065 [Streptomyces sp. NPDC058464]|uniref:hypothetical protein n=1 Tax=Streptomyces sp. NPDC058464 TaxID=3346511 RepID=UPI00364FE1C5
MDGGVLGDLEEMFGAVEAGLGVAVAVVAFAGGAGDAEGFAVCDTFADAFLRAVPVR